MKKYTITKLNKKIKRGIDFININNINLNHVPYTYIDLNDNIFIINILLKCNIPMDNIRIICYNYLNISKLITPIQSIHKTGTICPCKEIKCINQWITSFKNIFSISGGPTPCKNVVTISYSNTHVKYLGSNGSENTYCYIFHCIICHFIGEKDKHGIKCYLCEQFCCNTSSCGNLRRMTFHFLETEQYYCKKCIAIHKL